MLFRSYKKHRGITENRKQIKKHLYANTEPLSLFCGPRQKKHSPFRRSDNGKKCGLRTNVNRHSYEKGRFESFSEDIKENPHIAETVKLPKKAESGRSFKSVKCRLELIFAVKPDRSEFFCGKQKQQKKVSPHFPAIFYKNFRGLKPFTL